MKTNKNTISEAASEIQNNTTTLERFIHDDENGLDYELVGDYYFPLLTSPESPKIGAFGNAHFHYLRTEKKVLFDGLLLSGELNEYLENIDRQAEEMFEKNIKDLAEKEGVTEKLKSETSYYGFKKCVTSVTAQPKS